THDNDTAKGWYQGLKKAASARRASDARDAYVRAAGYFGDPPVAQIPMEMMKAAHHSVAHTSIIPTQDILELGPEGRMNVPGTANGNWAWRMTSKDLRHAGWEKL